MVFGAAEAELMRGGLKINDNSKGSFFAFAVCHSLQTA
jgi:hypothetical protein